MKNTLLLSCFFLLFFSACKKQTIIDEDNPPPVINNVSSVKIENYVNRIFIDLLGREPLDTELTVETQALRAADLETPARLALIIKLQTATDTIPGDTTYTQAYHQHLYALAKARCLEGASDLDIDDYISGSDDSLTIMRLEAVKHSRTDLQTGEISIEEMFGRMINNAVYDDINMNTFNFVRASFDNLLWRFPTDYEFQSGFSMIEDGTEETLFGQTGSSKEDYMEILISSPAMFEGMIIWAYRQLLARNPTTTETVALLENFYLTKDFQTVQRTVMVTDEYAGF